jgi:hypothetical protein
MNIAESVWYASIGGANVVDDDRQEKTPLGGHQMGPIDRKFPLKAEVPLRSRGGIARNDGNEQRTRFDLPPDRSVPGITPPKRTLIEPDLDSGRPKAVANSPCRLGIPRGVANENAV